MGNEPSTSARDQANQFKQIIRLLWLFKFMFLRSKMNFKRNTKDFINTIKHITWNIRQLAPSALSEVSASCCTYSRESALTESAHSQTLVHVLWLLTGLHGLLHISMFPTPSGCSNLDYHYSIQVNMWHRKQLECRKAGSRSCQGNIFTSLITIFPLHIIAVICLSMTHDAAGTL